MWKRSPYKNLLEKVKVKEIKEKVNNGECVMFKSDKSSKLTLDSAENYRTAIVIDQKQEGRTQHLEVWAS